MPRRRLGAVACLGLGLTAAILAAIAAGWIPVRAGSIADAWPVYMAIVLIGGFAAYLWLDETLAPVQVAGGLVVLLGIGLAQTARPPATTRSG